MKPFLELAARSARLWVGFVVGLLAGAAGLIAWLSSTKVALTWLLVGFLATVVVVEAGAFGEVARERDKAREDLERAGRQRPTRVQIERDRTRELADRMMRDFANAEIRATRDALADLMAKGQEVSRELRDAIAADPQGREFEPNADAFKTGLVAWEADVTTWLSERMAKPRAIQFTHAVEAHYLPSDSMVWGNTGEALTQMQTRMRAALDFLDKLIEDQRLQTK
jgi:hypothetical protein